MTTRLKSIELFEKITDQEVEKAAAESSSLADIIRAIDEGRDWALDFYELSVEERKTAFLYAYQQSIQRKRELVSQFKGFKPADIFANIFNIPLIRTEGLRAILFEDHIHFLIGAYLKTLFRLPNKQGRLITFLSDSEHLSDYGRYFAGTVSIVDENYDNLEEAAYHERYHGLTNSMPLSQTVDIVGYYWRKLKGKVLEPNSKNVTDFLIMKSLTAHLEVNAMYHTLKGLDQQRLLSAYYHPSIFQVLGIFFPDYVTYTRTIKGGAPAKVISECLKIYRRHLDIMGEINTGNNKKVQLYLELLMYNELEKLPQYVFSRAR